MADRSPLNSRMLSVMLLLFASFVGLPVAIYLIGDFIVGDYAGNSGLLGFIGSIYADAARGRWIAWALLAAPALWVTTWLGVRQVHRHRRQSDRRN